MAKKNETEAKGKKESNLSADAQDSKEASSKEPKKAETAQSGGGNLGEFFQGTREELGKVVWPSRQQLVSESVAVVLMVALSATLIYFIDQLFGWIATQVFVG